MGWAMTESYGNPSSAINTAKDGTLLKSSRFGPFHFSPETMLDGFLKTADAQLKFNPSLKPYVDQAKALLAQKGKNPAAYTDGAVQIANAMFKGQDPALIAQVQALIVAKSGDYVAHFLGTGGAKNLREAAAGKNNIGDIGTLIKGLTETFPKKDLDKHLTNAANPFISPNMETAARSNASYFFSCTEGANSQCKARLPSETLKEIERRVAVNTELFETKFAQLRDADPNTEAEKIKTPVAKKVPEKKQPATPTKQFAGQPK
jgi:hypothetical protein